MKKLFTLVLLALGLSASLAQAQPEPVQAEQAYFDPVTTQKLRELACRKQVARNMQKLVTLPPGMIRAWELERVQRESFAL